MGFEVKDYYYKKAKKEHYLARSAYKLAEIDKKYKLFEAKSENALDLGYYPGSWVQYISRLPWAKRPKTLVGVDLQPLNTKLKLPGVELFEKDFLKIEKLEELGVQSKFSLILSDMAPKTTGIKLADQQGSLELVEKIFYCLPKFLEEGGKVVIKFFESSDIQQLIKEQKKNFLKTHFFKPKSTRSCSVEVYFIGLGFKK